MADSRVHCNFCRRHVHVDRITGWLVPHRTKPGRKGHHCAGVGRLPEARPETRVA